MQTPEEYLQEEVGGVLTVEVDGAKLYDAYRLLEKYNRAIDSQAAFSRYVGLARSTVWHLFHDQDRLPWLRTLRKMSDFLLYHLGRIYGPSYGWTPEEMAEILLSSEALKRELVRKLSEKPGDNER
jgi:transcriptional regulator with XRE-family HTH domain